MNKKLIVTGTVCAALLCTAAFAAPASNTDSAPAAPAVTAPAVDPSVPLDAPTAMPEEAIPYSIGIKATVTEVLKSESGASIEVKPEDGETIVLNVSDKPSCWTTRKQSRYRLKISRPAIPFTLTMI